MEKSEMSHFTVLVIGEEVDAQLEKYDENLRVEWYDLEPEYREEYENGSRRMKKLPNGETVFPWAREYIIPGPDGRPWNNKYEFPAGTEDVEVPYKEIYPDFVTYVREYHSVEKYKEGDKLGYEHNPDAKWDWYQVGGRWTGFFKLKDNADVNNFDISEPGCMTPQADIGYADIVLKGDVDWDEMIKEYQEKRLVHYRQWHNAIRGREVPLWKDIHEKHGEDIEAAREEYGNHEVISDLRKAEFHWFDDKDVKLYSLTKNAFLEKVAKEAITTFAIVKDGEWYEKGKMGWFAIVTDEEDPDSWNEFWYNLVMNLPDDTKLTLVDCHI